MTKLLQKSKTSMQNDKIVKNNVKCQGHLKVKVIMLHVCRKVLA